MKILNVNILQLPFDRSGHSGTLIVDKNPDPETVVANQDSAFELSGITDLYFGLSLIHI